MEKSLPPNQYPLSEIIDHQLEKKVHPRLRFKDLLNAVFGKADPLQRILEMVNWRYGAAGIGFLAALAHLVLIYNPDVCYLYAQSQVRGFEVTLPEAMASVYSMGWLDLILIPLLLSLVLVMISFLIYRISRALKGNGSFHDHFGMITIAAALILLGQITGYIIVGSKDLKGLNDLRDLTPGVGLGLLPWLAVERIGLFYREIVRGFDLFGIWLILLATSMLRIINGFSRLKSFLLVFGYFGAYLVLRWVFEGPGYQLWHYFWTTGSI